MPQARFVGWGSELRPYCSERRSSSAWRYLRRGSETMPGALRSRRSVAFSSGRKARMVARVVPGVRMRARRTL